MFLAQILESMRNLPQSASQLATQHTRAPVSEIARLATIDLTQVGGGGAHGGYCL